MLCVLYCQSRIVSSKYYTNFSSLVYVEYSCTAGVNCKIGPQIWYTNGGGAIISHIGTLPNDVTLINITEWITTIKNQQSGLAYQGSYHQGIHYDSNWIYQTGNVKSLNLWYSSGQTKTISVHSVYNADQGDKTYTYLFLA